MLSYRLAIFALLCVDGTPQKPECCCQSADELSVWCDACGVGHVASVRIQSRQLFDALDAHGHDVLPQSFRCDECKKAFKADGFCHRCKIGFVHGKAYFSRLTYTLALGTLTKPGSFKCTRCREHTRSAGWCEQCNVGLVGCISFRDKQVFERAQDAVRVLRKAIEKLDECPSCAVALAVDRRCQRCKKSYEGGRQLLDHVR